MLGLIKKDILMLKNNIKTILLIAVIYLIFAQGQASQIAFMLSFISIMVSMSSFSYDAYNHWDTFACALPKGRKNIVLAKYTSGIIMLLISSITTIILGLLLNITLSKVDIQELLIIVLISALIIIMIESLIYPFIFKFGIEKGRYILFIGSFLIAGLGAYVLKSNINISKGLTNILNNYWYIILPIIALLMLIISIMISLHIYKNKEF